VFFRYPGGKNKIDTPITDRIVNFFIKNGYDYQYREPFFGAGAIGIRLFQSMPLLRNIWINDIDSGISSIWTSVINDPEGLISLIKGFSPSVTAFYDFKAALTRLKDNIPQNANTAFQKVAIHQMSFSGLGTMSGGPLGGREQKSEYKIDSRWNAGKLVKKIEYLHRVLGSRMFENGGCDSKDFEEIVTAPSKAFLYLEPPYHEKGPTLYQHSFSNRDHYRLSSVLQQIDNPWLLSYDDCPSIKKIYQWAEYKKTNIDYLVGRSKTKTELLITSKKYRYLLEDPNNIPDIFA
jgi:DNA adenine methylase